MKMKLIKYKIGFEVKILFDNSKNSNTENTPRIINE